MQNNQHAKVSGKYCKVNIVTILDCLVAHGIRYVLEWCRRFFLLVYKALDLEFGSL